MSADISADPEPAEPHPPRLRWTKRLSLLAAVFAAIYLAGFFLWRHQAHRRLQREIDALHAKGEPILKEDFKDEIVPDADNAALSYIAAANAVAAMPTTQLEFADSLELFYPLDAMSRGLLAQVANAAQPAMGPIRAARFQTHADWKPSTRQWNLVYVIKLLAPQRQLNLLEKAVAANEHLHQSDDAAIEIARDMVRHGAADGELYPSILSILISSTTNTEAFSLIRYLAGDLNTDPKLGTTTQPTVPASREQVIALIQELLDETIYRRQLEASLRGERTFSVNLLQNEPFSVVQMRPPPGQMFWQPNFDLEAVHLIRFLNTVIESNRTNYQRAVATTPPNPILEVRETGTPLTVMTRLDVSNSFNFRGLYSRIYENLANRRVAAIALACRLYQIDHNNDFPRALSELAPNYLPKVPSDPFAADNRPLGYRLSPRPTVYSVGIDGVDNGGDWQIVDGKPERDPSIPPGHPLDSYMMERKDIPFLLGDLRLVARPQSNLTMDQADGSNSTTNPATQPAE